MTLLIVLRTLSPVAILVAVAVGLLVMGIKSYYSRKSVVERYLRKIPRKSIGAFNNGEHGKITGHALLAGNYFDAPLSGRRCVYYRIVVEQYKNTSRGGGYWSTIIDDEEAADVVMTDGKHYAIVEAKNARCYLVPDREYSSGFMRDPNRRLKEFLSWYEKEHETLLGFNKKMRYSEGILEPNEKFTVSGTGEWRDAKEYEFDLPCQRVLILKPDLREVVHLSDDPNVVNDAGKRTGDKP